MPKKIDEELKARAVRLANAHQSDYSSLTAAAAVVAKQLGVGKESVRRWVIQSQVDGGQRHGATTEEAVDRQRGDIDAPGFPVSDEGECGRSPTRRLKPAGPVTRSTFLSSMSTSLAS